VRGRALVSWQRVHCQSLQESVSRHWNGTLSRWRAGSVGVPGLVVACVAIRDGDDRGDQIALCEPIGDGRCWRDPPDDVPARRTCRADVSQAEDYNISGLDGYVHLVTALTDKCERYVSVPRLARVHQYSSSFASFGQSSPPALKRVPLIDLCTPCPTSRSREFSAVLMESSPAIDRFVCQILWNLLVLDRSTDYDSASPVTPNRRREMLNVIFKHPTSSQSCDQQSIIQPTHRLRVKVYTSKYLICIQRTNDMDTYNMIR
jgi:hypothetical protein